MPHESGILLPIFSEVDRLMRRIIAALGLLIAAAAVYAAPAPATTDWKAKVAATMPLFGHRNWILIVDSAYPLQSSPGVETIDTKAGQIDGSPGVETIDTKAGQIDVVQSVLNAINNSIHVRPDIYMDAELPFVPDQDAPGASAYRKQIADVLHGYAVESVLHDKVIATIGETCSQFHVLVLKTNMTIPYSSVFIRLDCKYWSADAEKHMREMMNAERPPAAR